MFKTHKTAVNTLFDDNSRGQNTLPLQINTMDFMMDSQIPVERKIEEHEKIEIRQNNRRKETIFLNFENVYTHQKQIVVFLMKICKRLRSLSKERSSLGEMCKGLGIASLLVLKKGILLNEKAIRSLGRKKNIFEIDCFEEAVGWNLWGMILETLIKDNKFYHQILNHLLKKLAMEYKNPDPATQKIFNIGGNINVKLKEVQTTLEREAYFLTDCLINKENLDKTNIFNKVKLRIKDLYLGTMSSKSFQYKTNGIPYDWEEFFKQRKAGNIKVSIKNIEIELRNLVFEK